MALKFDKKKAATTLRSLVKEASGMAGLSGEERFAFVKTALLKHLDDAVALDGLKERFSDIVIYSVIGPVLDLAIEAVYRSLKEKGVIGAGV